jgi:hypothetical protein
LVAAFRALAAVLLAAASRAVASVLLAAASGVAFRAAVLVVEVSQGLAA